MVKKCPFCACEFVADYDLELHLKTFGNSREEHVQRLRYLDFRTENSRGE